jgi:DNA-binding Lrp family transcriptional regulator
MELPLSRRDLASMIGTRHETLSRIISRLEEDGVARFSGRTVHVRKPHVAAPGEPAIGAAGLRVRLNFA